MFNKKDVKLYKFNLKVVKLLPLIIADLVLLFGLVLGVVDSFVLEEIIDLGTPVVSFIAWLLLTVVSAALLCALTGVIANAYLLHIYYLTSINNQLLANKKVEVEQKVETKIEEPVEDAE